MVGVFGKVRLRRPPRCHCANPLALFLSVGLIYMTSQLRRPPVGKGMGTASGERQQHTHFISCPLQTPFAMAFGGEQTSCAWTLTTCNAPSLLCSGSGKAVCQRCTERLSLCVLSLAFPLSRAVEAPSAGTHGAQAMARRREGLDEVRSALKAARSCQRLLRPVAMRRTLKEASQVPRCKFPSSHARGTRLAMPKPTANDIAASTAPLLSLQPYTRLPRQIRC